MRADGNRIASVDFVKECKEDISSPTTSTFTSKLAVCRATILALEESLDADRLSLKKLKNATKAMYNSGQTHTNNKMAFVENLEKLGNSECNKSVQDTDPDIGNAFLRLSCFMRNIYHLYDKLVTGMNKHIMNPLEMLLKGDLKDVKGDMKRPFDKSWKDYDTKVKHVEREKRQLAKEAGMIRGEISGSEIAEEMERERRMFQLQMCEYLIKANDIKTKKEVELLQHMVNFYECQNTFFTEGLKVIQQFQSYTDKLTSNLKTLRQTHEAEKKQLQEVRTLLRSSFNDKEDGANKASAQTVYNLHQMQGNRMLGNEKEGYLHKKSEGLRKTWQKRKCSVKDGFLSMQHHNLSSKPPVKLNLLTSQIKHVPEDKKQFDLVSHNRTYRFMAESESETRNWVSVLQNSKLDMLNQVFDSDTKKHEGGGGSGLKDLTRAIIDEIKRIPTNNICCDCNSENPTWLSTNLGVLLCIECSGIHREMGVHVSRIQSITLDELGTSELLLARTIGNHHFNEVMEEQLDYKCKPTKSSDMEERKAFIRGKYIDRKYVVRTCGHNSRTLADDLGKAIRSCDLQSLLQIFAEQADLSDPLPGYGNNETALHVASAMSSNEGLASILPLVDFLSQNIGSQGLNMQTGDGDTALHICAQHNNTECMKLLLRSRAKTDIDNKAGESAMGVAVRLNHQSCVELLKQANSSRFRALIYIDIEWNLTYPDDDNDFISDDELEDKNLPSQPPPAVPISTIVGGITVKDSPSVKDYRSRSSNTPPVLPPRNPPPVPLHSSKVGQKVRSQTANMDINFAPWSGMPTPSGSSSRSRNAEHSLSFSSPGGPSERSSAASVQKHASSRTFHPAVETPPHSYHEGARSALKRSDHVSPSQAPDKHGGATKQSVTVVAGKSPMDVRLRPKPATNTPLVHRQPSSGFSGHQSPDLRRVSSNGGAGSTEGTPQLQKSPQQGARCKSLLETNTPAGVDSSRVKRLSARFASSSVGIVESQPSPASTMVQRAAAPPPRLPHFNHHQRQNSNPTMMMGLLHSNPASSTHSLPRNVRPPTNQLPPKPAPRMKTPPVNKKTRRVRAMYDCDADNDDELTFCEGEVIVVTDVEDGEWWIGHVEHQLHRSGVFPVKFVEEITS